MECHSHVDCGDSVVGIVQSVYKIVGEIKNPSVYLLETGHYVHAVAFAYIFIHEGTHHMRCSSGGREELLITSKVLSSTHLKIKDNCSLKVVKF